MAQEEKSDYKKNIVDLMIESQEYRSLIFYIASVPTEDRPGLSKPSILDKSWDSLIDGNNADFAVLNYYVRNGLLK
ncbi:MAG: hypothetical protein COB02_00365 [Candidatus Cloacimonadota bacterium]|nr:MAG: hypothetical protein COB02_00365 [Candidatus Cloacimonadota bacterium]